MRGGIWLKGSLDVGLTIAVGFKAIAINILCELAGAQSTFRLKKTIMPDICCNTKSLTMKKVIHPLSAIIVSFYVLGCNQAPSKISDIDQNSILFVKNGIEGGLTEIKASGLAITNSNNQKVISFAKMLIDDHTKANDVLKKLESDKKISETDTISSAHKLMLDDLSKKTGAAFDKAYLQTMVADHEQVIKLFMTASKNTDPEIVKFATTTLPTLKLHLDSANAICIALK